MIRLHPQDLRAIAAAIMTYDLSIKDAVEGSGCLLAELERTAKPEPQAAPSGEPDWHLTATAQKETIEAQAQRIAELEAELRDALAEIGVSTLSTVQTHLHERIAQLEKESQGLWSANTDMSCAISKLSRELGNPVLDGDDPLGMQVVNYALARIAELEAERDRYRKALKDIAGATWNDCGCYITATFALEGK